MFIKEKRWAGPPNNIFSPEKDFFYFTRFGRASERYINENNYDKIKESCFESSQIILKREGITISYDSGIHEAEDTISCKGYRIEKKSEMRIGFFEIERRKKYNEYLFSTIRLLYCHPLGKPGQLEYKECECIYYLHLKGGRDTLVKNFYKILCEYTDEELCQKKKICNQNY